MASAFREERPILNPEYNSSIRDRTLTVTGNWQPGYSGLAHKVNFGLRVVAVDTM
jgi:hypothetical protein